MRRFLMSLAAVATLSLSAGAVTVMAGEQAAPIPEGVRVVSTDELNALKGKPNVYIFDARSHDAYEKSHLDGAQNLPLAEFDAKKLPADKTAQLIFYCGGPSCPLAPTSAGKAKAAGYQNVAVWHEWHPKS